MTVDEEVIQRGKEIPADQMNRLLQGFLEPKSERTKDAYSHDLEQFRKWMNVESIGRALEELLTNGAGEANMLALEYRNYLKQESAPSTANRRLSTIRSVSKMAERIGLIRWSLSIESLQAESYRDTRGPGPEGFQKMLSEAKDRRDAKGVRDVAIMRLLHDLALRRGEVVSLDMSDVNFKEDTIRIDGKGRDEKETLSIPEITTQALQKWIQIRGNHDGALFVNLDRSCPEERRITGTGVYLMTKKYGEEAGVERSHPHGLRHLAVTQALNKTDGDLRAVQRFSRHQDVTALRSYDDRRHGLQEKVAGKVAEI